MATGGLATCRAGGYQVPVEPLAWLVFRPAKADYSLSAQTCRVAAVLDSLPSTLRSWWRLRGPAWRSGWRMARFVAAVIARWRRLGRRGVPGLAALRSVSLLRLFGGTGLIRKKVRQALIQFPIPPGHRDRHRRLPPGGAGSRCYSAPTGHGAIGGPEPWCLI
jgi:hypothetical protein